VATFGAAACCGDRFVGHFHLFFYFSAAFYTMHTELAYEYKNPVHLVTLNDF